MIGLTSRENVTSPFEPNGVIAYNLANEFCKIFSAFWHSDMSSFDGIASMAGIVRIQSRFVVWDMVNVEMRPCRSTA